MGGIIFILLFFIFGYIILFIFCEVTDRVPEVTDKYTLLVVKLNLSTLFFITLHEILI